MARDYEALARTIVELVGGEDNVKSVTHCITRLRFTLNDEKKAQTEKLNQTEGVISVLVAAGQYQIVIGNHVTDVYDALPKVSSLAARSRTRTVAASSTAPSSSSAASLCRCFPPCPPPAFSRPL